MEKEIEQLLEHVKVQFLNFKKSYVFGQNQNFGTEYDDYNQIEKTYIKSVLKYVLCWLLKLQC